MQIYPNVLCTFLYAILPDKHIFLHSKFIIQGIFVCYFHRLSLTLYPSVWIFVYITINYKFWRILKKCRFLKQHCYLISRENRMSLIVAWKTKNFPTDHYISITEKWNIKKNKKCLPSNYEIYGTSARKRTCLFLTYFILDCCILFTCASSFKTPQWFKLG